MASISNWLSATPNWISAIADSVVAGGLLLAWWQLRTSRDELLAGREELRAYREEVRSSHERADRERAVDTVAAWSLSGDRRGAIARRLIEDLSKKQIECIVDQRALDIEADHEHYLSGILDSMPTIEGGRYKLDARHAIELRWIVISYLNRLEAALAGWFHKIADEKIIEEQYAFLVHQGEGRHILSVFRAALRRRSETDPYPAIEAFAVHLDHKHRPPPRPGPLREEELLSG